MPQVPGQPAITPERKKFPAHFTFSQRNGYEPLPEPMRLGHLSNDLRRELWNLVWSHLGELETRLPSKYNHSRTSERAIKLYHTRIIGKFTKIPESQIFGHMKIRPEKIYENIIVEEKLNEVFDFLEILINESPDLYLLNGIVTLFDKHAAAYQLDLSQFPYWFFPRVSKEQGESTQQAIEKLHQGEMKNSTNHLRQAVEHIKMRKYAHSVADSIHAVESVAGETDPNSNKTLGKSLDSLEKNGFLTQEARLLKEALKKLHGYASQAGIRHGAQNGSTVNVGLDEAMLMYGVCASFAAYLTRKHQSSQNRQGLKTNPRQPVTLLPQGSRDHK